MTHPEDLLADYVDGTLDEPQRAVVDTHLAECASCADEVATARRAVSALASLEDEPVPFGVTGPVLAEAGRRLERRRSVVWERVQWALGAAAAAALVLVVALNLGGGAEPGQDAAREQVTAAGAEAGAEAPAATGGGSSLAFVFRGLERQEDVDYDDAGIVALARDAVPIVTGQLAQAEDQAAFAPADDALACIEQSGAPTVGDPRDTLLRVIEAEYAGTPAYIAVYAEGPGAGQPADRVVVWAVAVDDCRILTTASLRI
jgi:hypothetical protein